MKRIASLVVALLATLVFAASVSAAPTSITLDQAQPVAPGSQVTFTVSGVRAALVYNVCGSTSGSYPSETLPVVAGSAGPFTISSEAVSCHATALDKKGHALISGGDKVLVSYCSYQPGWACFVD